MPQIMLNGSRLQSIATASQTAQEITLHLLARKRLRTFSDLYRTRNRLLNDGKSFVEQDALAYWKALQDTGLGSLVYSKKGSPKFYWFYSMKLVAQAAIEGKEVLAPRIAEQPKDEPVKAKIIKLRKKPRGRPPGAKNKSKAIPQVAVMIDKSYAIHIRKGLNVSIQLPKDFSKDDVDVFSEGLKSLL